MKQILIKEFNNKILFLYLIDKESVGVVCPFLKLILKKVLIYMV